MLTYLLDTHSSHLMTNFDSFVKCFTGNKRTQNSSSKSVTCSVGVNDLFAFERMYRVNLWFCVI